MQAAAWAEVAGCELIRRHCKPNHGRPTGSVGVSPRLHNSDSLTIMKNKPQDQREWHERRIDEARKRDVAPEPTKDGAHGRPVEGGAPESEESRKTFPKRQQKPGEVGLANEARPGLGTRADDADPANADDKPATPAKSATDSGQPKATRYGYEEPRPAPREQPPDSLAHEQERSTGASGQSSGG